MATQILTTTFDISELKTLITDSITEALKQLASVSTPEPVSEKQILTRQETADLLNISLPTLADYTKRGLIKGNRFGSLVRYRLDDINDALVAMKTGTMRK